jgi:2-phospho-L-lactate guanylyltransferase (CobY/MobA/RfbA family)
MNSHEFAADRPWISFQTAVAIAEKHGLADEMVDEVLLGGDIETRADGAEVNTYHLILWLGY